MPRRVQNHTDSPVTRALDDAVREYDEADALMKEKDAKLRAAIVEAAREAMQPKNPLTITEISERVGWRRETISRIATEAGVKQRETGHKKK